MPIFANPEKILAISNGLLIFAALMTVIATFLIVYFGGRVTALKEQQLKAYQGDADARIADANARTAIASVEVAKANATAAQASVASDTANQRAQEAGAHAQEASLKAAAANAEAERSKTARVELQLELAKLTKANAEAERKLAIIAENAKPRTLTEEQRLAIIAELKQSVAALRPEDRVTVPLQLTSNNFEANILTTQLTALFKEAGIEIVASRPPDRTAEGSGIMLADGDQVPPIALAISFAFQHAKSNWFILRSSSDSGLKSGEWFLFIGDKRTIRVPQ